jgi:hypothetical protein
MSYTVTLPYDSTETAIDWARENCPSYITNGLDYVGPGGGLVAELRIKYYFGEEKDATIFALRWS